MKKILILANNVGGLYNFRFEFIIKLIKEDFEIFFAVPQSKNHPRVQLIKETGAKHIHTPFNRRGINPFEDLKLIKKYKEIVKGVNPDVILTYTIKPNIYGAYVAKKYKKPLIMNVTGVGSSLATGKLKVLVKQMYKYACTHAKIVFFQNQSNLDFFIYNQMISRKKTRLIPGSGVNLEKFKPMPKEKDDNLLKFLFIGRVMKDKGIEEYIKVAKRLRLKHSGIEFQVLGAFEEDKYKRNITESKEIKYLGISSDVRQQIREADCIVHPSYHEGMSNVLLEGAAMGKPLIASKIPGCMEIIEDGSNGYLFKVKSVESLEEKLVQFIELDEKTRAEMGKRSREKVEKEFDRKIVVNEYIDAINSVLKGSM